MGKHYLDGRGDSNHVPELSIREHIMCVVCAVVAIGVCFALSAGVAYIITSL